MEPQYIQRFAVTFRLAEGGLVVFRGICPRNTLLCGRSPFLHCQFVSYAVLVDVIEIHFLACRLQRRSLVEQPSVLRQH